MTRYLKRDAWEKKPGVQAILRKLFWVDKDNLLFLKVRVKSSNKPRSVEFSKYEIIDEAPVATVIRFYNEKGDLKWLRNILMSSLITN